MNKLIKYFKKKWPGLLCLSFLIILLVFLIPVQEKSYLREDADAIENRSWLITAILAGISIIVAGIILLKNLKSSGFTNLLIACFWILSFSFFIFSPLLRFTIFSANKISRKEIFEKSYVVQGMTGSKTLLFFHELGSDKNDFFIDNRIKIDTTSLSGYDTVNISFRKGLFGYKYLADFTAMKK